MPRVGPVHHHHHHYSSHYMSHSKLQSPLTIQWLNDNYEVAEGVSLPRSALYNHYLDFCQKNNLTPVNAASFGKIIRHTFPNLKTRRLGTRGQSKYHYYGITIKETSPYHDTVCNAARQSASGFSQTYSKSEADERLAGNQKNPNASHSSLMVASGGTLLPDFPSTIRLKLPENVLKDKVKTFLIMYRAHCQRILDTILRANFGEVQNFLVHFWQGMPNHMLEVLGCQEVVDIIGLCDSILYKSIGSVLIPGTLQPLPASLTQAIRQFAKQLSVWLENSLSHLPKPLQEKKLTVAKNFSHSLQRQTSLTHLAQAARTVLHSAEPVTQMLGDWKHIDFESITRQALWTFSNEPEKDYAQVNEFYKEFTQLLDQQATIDQYAEWAASLVDRCVSKKSEKSEQSYQECAQEFLLKWSFFSTRVVRELTLRSAQSFGSFHLLHMLLEDYILYVVETKTSGNEDEFAAMVAREQASEAEESNLKPSSQVIDMVSASALLRGDEPSNKQKSSLVSSHTIEESLIPKLPSNLPAMRSPTYAQVAPVPALSSPGSDSAYASYPSSKTGIDMSSRYNLSSATSYMFPMSSTDRIYQASGIHPSPVGNNLTDLTSRGSYSPYRDIQTSSSRAKSSVSMGTGNYGMIPSPYDYRPPSVPPNCYTQYPLPDRTYAPGYVLTPGVVTPSPMYPSGHTDRYFPDAIEEFVDMQAAGHHGVDHRLNTFTPTILST